MMCAGWEGDNFVSSAGIIYIVLLCFITRSATACPGQLPGLKSEELKVIPTLQVVLKKSLTENFLKIKHINLVDAQFTRS